jgi:FMN phosphatase YigB (HAD superfamily)
VEGEALTMSPEEIVFLFDVDNTLLDNDQVVVDLMGYLEREIGAPTTLLGLFRATADGIGLC